MNVAQTKRNEAARFRKVVFASQAALEAQQEVWGNPNNLLSVSYTPSPTVEAVDGGLKIAGSWPYGVRNRR